MLFDQRPTELPLATIRSRRVIDGLGGDLRRWLSARWRWLEPRTVPVLVAMIGMIAVLGSAHYLTNLALAPPERIEAPASTDDSELAALTIEVGPAPAAITIDGEPQRSLPRIIELPSSRCQIKVIPLDRNDP